jgi:peptidoglycan biosynthesis protein MviN/MurJ (putative lipid II flippase)
VASWCILGNFTLNVLSVIYLPEGWRHAGIAASTCINSLVNTLILLVILRRRGIPIQLWGLCPVTAKTLLAAAVMGAAAYFGYGLLIQWCPKWLALFTAIAVGGCTYFPMVALLAPDAMREVLSDFKFRRKRR